MLYEIGLLCTVGLGLWVLVDVAGARPRRLQALPTALLGASSALWAGGELLITHAAGPEEILLGRRLLYLGTAVLPIAWLWAAADAARARWLARAPWLLALAAVPQAAIYAFLYTEAHAWFVHATAQPPLFGPLFWAHAAIGWSLISLGTGYFLLAAVRLGKASMGRMLAIVIGHDASAAGQPPLPDHQPVPDPCRSHAAPARRRDPGDSAGGHRLRPHRVSPGRAQGRDRAAAARACWSRISRARSSTPTPPPPASSGRRSWPAGPWRRCWPGCSPTAHARSRWRVSR